MSYNKNYKNIIGQYDGTNISKLSGIQISNGLGDGTINLTNGSTTATVNDINITNISGYSIGYNTNDFNIDNTLNYGTISIIDSLTNDIYVLRISYVSINTFNIDNCRKYVFSTNSTNTTVTFSGLTGTYQYYIGNKGLSKNNSIIIGNNVMHSTNTDIAPILSYGAGSIIIASSSRASTGRTISGIGNILISSDGNSTITGDRAIVIGSATATGDSSFSIGLENTVSNLGAMTFGSFLTASGTYATCIGNGSGLYGNIIAAGNNSIILTSTALSISNGDFSTIIGGYNESSTVIYSNGLSSSVINLSRNSGSILGIQPAGDKYSTILGGNDCYIGVLNNNTGNSTYNTAIIGSQASAIYQSSTTDTSLMIYTGIYSSNNSYIRSLANASNLRTCTILVSENSTITNNTGAQIVNNTLLNCNNVTLQNTNNTTVIGQTTTTTITESNIVYIGKEIVGGKVAVTVLSAALANTSNVGYSIIISFNAKAGATYRLRLIGTYQTAATTTGIKIRMQGTAVANVAGYMQGQITAATGATGLRATIGTMTAELITTGVSAINTAHAIEGNIIVRCTTAGSVMLLMASEVNASSAQLNIGTSVIVERVI